MLGPLELATTYGIIENYNTSDSVGNSSRGSNMDFGMCFNTQNCSNAWLGTTLKLPNTR